MNRSFTHRLAYCLEYAGGAKKRGYNRHISYLRFALSLLRSSRIVCFCGSVLSSFIGFSWHDLQFFQQESKATKSSTKEGLHQWPAEHLSQFR